MGLRLDHGAKRQLLQVHEPRQYEWMLINFSQRGTEFYFGRNGFMSQYKPREIAPDSGELVEVGPRRAK